MTLFLSMATACSATALSTRRSRAVSVRPDIIQNS